jgi:hypothetical protein
MPGERALTGDYSPRTGGILPNLAGMGNPGRQIVAPVGPDSATDGAVDAKALGVLERLAVAQVLLDQRWVLEEAVGHQA